MSIGDDGQNFGDSHSTGIGHRYFIIYVMYTRINFEETIAF